MKKINLILDIDDCNPSKGWGLEMDNSEFKYLNLLFNEFPNLKVTMFVPANFKNVADLRLNRKWVEWLKSKPIEICGHGVTHYNQGNKDDCREFIGISDNEIKFKLKECKKIFQESGIDVKGFRVPGWDCTQDFYEIVPNYFEYLAEHRVGSDVKVYENSSGNKVFLVPYTYSIDNIGPKYFDTIILHGHISQRDGNKNGLNEIIYQNIRDYINELESKFEINYLTMSELIEELNNNMLQNKSR